MAGPGGGPPRKSHTKSRKGCRKCKKRHIRCDENFPQCRNCTKHNVRCDYMDVAKAGDEPAKGSNPPELLTSPQLQQALDNWRITGESPLPELRKPDLSYWTRFSTIDLRLIHHVTTLSSEMYRRGYSHCMPWTPKMSNLISVALSTDYAMSALLALSASHLAWDTKNIDTEHLALLHRSTALRGVHEALNSFTEHSSESVLAASMLLSWQAQDWQTWKSLQHGISQVTIAMRPWMAHSELAQFLDSQSAIARNRVPPTPSLPNLPPQPPAPEDIEHLTQVVNALHTLRLRLSAYEILTQHLAQVLEYVQQVQNEYPLQDVGTQYERLAELRSMIFWLPTTILQPEQSDLGALATMCHVYSLALVLEPLFPECQGAHLGNMVLDPLQKTIQMIQARAASLPHDTTIQTAVSMLDVPIQVVNFYRSSSRTLTSPSNAFHIPPPHSTFTSQPYATSPTDTQPRTKSYPTINTQSAYSAYPSNYNYGLYHSPVASRHDSIASRSQSDHRLSITSSLHSMSSPQSASTEPAPAPLEYFGGSTSYPAATGYGSMQDYSHPNRLVYTPSPRQIWT